MKNNNSNFIVKKVKKKTKPIEIKQEIEKPKIKVKKQIEELPEIENSDDSSIEIKKQIPKLKREKKTYDMEDDEEYENYQKFK